MLKEFEVDFGFIIRRFSHHASVRLISYLAQIYSLKLFTGTGRYKHMNNLLNWRYWFSYGTSFALITEYHFSGGR